MWYQLSESEQVQAELKLPDGLQTPVADDVPVGALVFTLDGAIIGETSLVCAAGVHSDQAPEAGPLERLWSLFPWAG